MDPQDLAIIAAFVIAYSIVSHRFALSAVAGPMVFVAFGLAVGPEALDVVELSLDNELVRELAELTLVLVLFTDAARIDFRRLRMNVAVPARMLGIGMPLTIGLGTVLAALLFDALTLWEPFLLAAVLAPTDAALGQAVVSNPVVPQRVRQALNVESGLNDGIAAPIVSVGIAGSIAILGFDAGTFALEQVGFGVLVGIGVGLVGGVLVDRASRHDWVDSTFQHIAMLACALLAFWLAEVVDGNGFIAAFIGGLVVGNVARDLGEGLFHFAEEEGQLLALLTFMVFGGAFVGPRLDDLTWQIALYAVLSLTVVRMLPVALSLIDMRFQPDTLAFLGWFGPRGLASIVFGLLVLETEGLGGGDEIFLVVTWTVLLSVYAHGLTAEPAARWYGRRTATMAELPDMPEMLPVPEMRIRIRPPEPMKPAEPREPG